MHQRKQYIIACQNHKKIRDKTRQKNVNLLFTTFFNSWIASLHYSEEIYKIKKWNQILLIYIFLKKGKEKVILTLEFNPECAFK